MKNILLLYAILLLMTATSFSQDLRTYGEQKQIIEGELQRKGEIYFKFYSDSRNRISSFTNIISIDNVKDNIINFEVFAYANSNEISEFAKSGLKFILLPHPGDGPGYKTSDNISEIMAWDTYPTYDAYVAMMYQFQSSYPTRCKIVDAGTTVQGRKILFAKISDSVDFRKNKPRFQYSSTMHGDETTGYVLMLRLIDTLLKGYGTDAKITNLVRNVEIWINPNANPDGTYHGGNSTVNGATRYNYNNFDINRNFPDPRAGPNPGGTWQPETIIFMNLAAANRFTLSANFHGGAEVLNYPWDTWSRLHPDDLWFIHAARHYADTVHAVNSSYLADLLGYPNIPGVVNGYAWYQIDGGRQDFMTYFKKGREITMEISHTKLLPPAQLPAHWNYNFKSLLNYIQESLYGVRGIVTDSVTGIPLKAKVTVLSHDADSSEVMCDSIIGDYHRLIIGGTYSLKFTAPGYYDKTISNVFVKNDSTTILNVLLKSTSTGISPGNVTLNSYKFYQNYPNPFNPATVIKFDVPYPGHVKILVYDVTGKMISCLTNKVYKSGSYSVNWNAGAEIPSGIYYCRMETQENIFTIKMALIR